MRRLTNKRTWEEAEDDLAAEYGYSHIWKRLNAIENILGDDYDLDRLRVLVEAADEERVEIKPAPYAGGRRVSRRPGHGRCQAPADGPAA